MSLTRASVEVAFILLFLFTWIQDIICRDEERISKACYWPNEVYEPCFAGCAEVSCDNPRNHLRPCYPYCEPGCVCEEPYVRDDRTHQCVLAQDCSPTQMGIPVPPRHASSKPPPAPPEKYSLPKSHRAREYPFGGEYEGRMDEPLLQGERVERGEPSRRIPPESRLGNYFNIVIAPPPIKSPQPRKLLRQNERGVY